MADGDPNSDPTKNDPAASAGDLNKDKKGTPDDKTAADAVAMAKELGETKAKLEAAQARNAVLEPVMQTIYSDEELLKKATEIHNKRTGVAPKDEPKKDDKIATTPQPSATEIDNRNAHIKLSVEKFSQDHGIDKLEKDKQAEINTRIGNELKEMLDPMGNKTLQQIMETVSVTKLPQFLEKAYFLATRNEQIESAKEEGKKIAAGESAGIIGSIPSSSITPDSVTLTAKEKEIAQKTGVSEEKYLENKKEILKRNGQLF